jgi:hypothetical protein
VKIKSLRQLNMDKVLPYRDKERIGRLKKVVNQANLRLAICIWKILHHKFPVKKLKKLQHMIFNNHSGYKQINKNKNVFCLNFLTP